MGCVIQPDVDDLPNFFNVGMIPEGNKFRTLELCRAGGRVRMSVRPPLLALVEYIPRFEAVIDVSCNNKLVTLIQQRLNGHLYPAHL